MGIPYAGKTASLYWDVPQVPVDETYSYSIRSSNELQWLHTDERVPG